MQHDKLIASCGCGIVVCECICCAEHSSLGQPLSELQERVGHPAGQTTYMNIRLPTACMKENKHLQAPENISFSLAELSGVLLKSASF